MIIKTNKKRAELTITQVVLMVLGVVVLIVLLFVLKIIPTGIRSLTSCSDWGQCRPGNVCAPNEYIKFEAKDDCPANHVCCVPTTTRPGPLQDFNEKELEYLRNAIIIKLNNDPTPISDVASLNLKVDTNYTFRISINDKLTKDKKTSEKLGPCAVYVVDTREAGKKYLLTNKGWDLILSDKEIDLSGIELAECTEESIRLKKYSPSLNDVYKDLVLYVILLDKEVVDALEVLETHDPGFVKLTAPGFGSGINLPDRGMAAFYNLTTMYSNVDHWLAYRAIRLNVEPVVQISGMSGIWVDKDPITISCPDVTCIRFGLKLVKLKDNDYLQLVEECKKPEGFKYTLDYVAGTTTKTTGIPLNINIGGFRIPPQRQKLQYIVSQKPITVVNNKADVLIDRATMLKTFYSGDHELLIEDTTYLCVEATKDDGSKVHGLSEQPIKVDVFPPMVDPDKDVQLFYPDPVISSDISTPYYYRKYPKIVVSGCYDYGQSGCTNYDYYIHSGEFVNLRSLTAEWEIGIASLILTEGLNALLTYFAEKDAVNTICPFITSHSYTRNTRNEIRIPRQGQGIICIRVSDKVGNKDIIWKVLWTPEEMFKKIIAEGVAEAEEAVTG
ncbi:hypothetical protein KY348_00445 [Candidatus Woesearchaeota archaeon]|nr:hypothetical protein [Candidatus Woesearchaeota archaeon]